MIQIFLKKNTVIEAKAQKLSDRECIKEGCKRFRTDELVLEAVQELIFSIQLQELHSSKKSFLHQTSEEFLIKVFKVNKSTFYWIILLHTRSANILRAFGSGKPIIILFISSLIIFRWCLYEFRVSRSLCAIVKSY